MYRLLVPVAFVVAVVVCIVGFERTRPRADFVFVSSGDVFTLDPQRMSWLSDLQIGYCLYEGLVRWNTEDFSIEPAAAIQYEISDDGLEYIFHLRKDARWSNGASVTAYDFRYAWMRLLTPDTASDYSSFFYSISGAKEYWDLRTKQLKDGAFVTLEELEESFCSIVEIKVLSQEFQFFETFKWKQLKRC